MTTKHRTIVMTALFIVPGMLALSQEPPAPPMPPAPPAAPDGVLMGVPAGIPGGIRGGIRGGVPARPALAPLPPRAWNLDEPVPPLPPIPAWSDDLGPMPPPTPLAPLAPMELDNSLVALAPMTPPAAWAEFGLLAYQEGRGQGVGVSAARARAEAHVSQDREDRYYRQGKAYLDRKEYDKAIDNFNRVIEEKGARTDGALYWRAYAQFRLGKRDEATASLNELQKSYPSSRWMDDAKALGIEGGQISPETATDEDLKLLAINALMNTDPERAVPLLEKLLKSSNSPRVKERALFVLAQSRSQKARDVLASVAKGASNPDLQAKAIDYLGVYGGKENAQVLADIYRSTSDVHVKRSILNSFMVSGSRESLLAVAKSETNPELKSQAIQLLGNVGGYADLAQLYTSDASPEVKKAIIQGLFISGNADKLLDLAKTEKDDGLRRLAINQLGVMGKSKTGNSLASLYAQETNPDNKKAIINALFIQGNAAALVEIARKESDMNLKKTIVNQLSVMHSKEATDYLMEILSK